MEYIDKANVDGKRVIVRCDFNVPIKDGEIVDDSRIVKSLETINYLLSKNASVILMSHLGRIKSREDKLENSLKVVGERLRTLLNKDVIFINEPVGSDVLNTCKNIKSGDVVLLENTRFCDFPEKLESKNDLELAKYWSVLGDIFVVDAFGSLHRAHSSVAGISKYLPTYFGFLVKKEMEGLKPAVENIKRPFAVFMGGAKVDDKLGYIKGLLPKCDYLMLGGGIANSFLYALGFDVKESLYTKDEEILEELRKLYKGNEKKIILPSDFAFDGDMILDIGKKSVDNFAKYFSMSNTIFINGTCGKFEDKRFAVSTVDLFNKLKRSNAIRIAGGGDTINAINMYNLSESFDYLSSGGGACLEYISSGHLEAVDFIEENKAGK